MNALKTMYVIVGDADHGVYSYTWRLWWHETSFYIKARNDAFPDFKVSLHGPDAFHPNPGFIVGIDQSSTRAEGTATLENGRFFGSRFNGRDVGNGVLHVATFRFGSELFEKGLPSTAIPQGIRNRPSILAGIAAAPSDGNVTDVHLYISEIGTSIPHAERAKTANAILGPLINKEGKCLTGLINQCSLKTNPSPDGLMGPPPRNESDRTRGFGGLIDSSGFLWIAEQWLSREHLQKSSVASSHRSD